MHFAERISVELLIYSQLLCIVSVRAKFYGEVISLAVHCCLIMNHSLFIQNQAYNSTCHKSLLVRWLMYADYPSHGTTELWHNNYIRLLTRLCTLWENSFCLGLDSTYSVNWAHYHLLLIPRDVLSHKGFDKFSCISLHLNCACSVSS